MSTPGKTRPFKFDYNSEEFYAEIERLALNGYTDQSIAYGLVEKFGVSLRPQGFSEFKNEKDEAGALTDRARRITEALARGRDKVNQAVRATYLQMALGQRKVKSQTTQRLRLPGGTLTDDEVISTTETEIQPSLQALSVWLFNHDKDWRDNVIAHKREEAEAGAENEIPAEVNVRITYNQRADLELQKKFEKPSQ